MGNAPAPALSPPAPASGLAFWWALAALLVATTGAYAPMLGHTFYSDDFRLVLDARDTGFGDTLRFLCCGESERPWQYWRPGWRLLFQLAHAAFGTAPAPYMVVALAMHLACVTALFALAQRLTANLPVACAAALLFALHPGHVEAVVWVAAAFNVLPAALLLFVATGAVAAFLHHGRVRALVTGAVLAVASFLWKEAAYGFPALLALAWWQARREVGLGARHRRWLFGAAASVALVVVAHYLWRNKMSGLIGSVGDTFYVVAANAAAFVRQLAPVPGGDIVVLLSTLGAMLASWLCLPGGGRFFLGAAVCGTVPYVFFSGGSRFAYFFHAPLAVALASGVAHWLGAGRSVARSWLAAAIVVAPLVLSPLSLAGEITRLGEHGRTAAALLTNLEGDGLLATDQLLVDHVPEGLMNGFEAAVHLRTGRSVTVASLQAVPRPPFVVYLDASGLRVAESTTILTLDLAAKRYVARPFGAATGGLLPVPVFALCQSFRLVRDEAEAQALVAGRQVDVVRTPLLFEAPATPPVAEATGTITGLRTDIRHMGVTVECTGTSLLLIAFPLPADFRRPPGAIWIDDRPVPVLAANLIFHAVVVPAGKHDVRLLPSFGR